MRYWLHSDDLSKLNKVEHPKMISDEMLQIKSDWLYDLTLHKQNLLRLRRRLTFRLHNTEWVTALHKSSGIYLAHGPSLSKTALLPKKSACFLQRAVCETDNGSISSAFPGRSAEKASYRFAWQTSWSSSCTQDCLPTRSLHVRFLMQRTKWTQSGSNQMWKSLFAVHSVPPSQTKTSHCYTT